MAAREEILRLINSYGFTIDTGDLDGFASLFEHGEWTVEGGTPNFGKVQVLATLSTVRIYPDGTPRTKHVTSNVDLEIDENSGTATCQSYVTLLQQTDELWHRRPTSCRGGEAPAVAGSRGTERPSASRHRSNCASSSSWVDGGLTPRTSGFVT